jgi:hypothetical protein
MFLTVYVRLEIGVSDSICVLKTDVSDSKCVFRDMFLTVYVMLETAVSDSICILETCFCQCMYV